MLKTNADCVLQDGIQPTEFVKQTYSVVMIIVSTVQTQAFVFHVRANINLFWELVNLSVTFPTASLVIP